MPLCGAPHNGKNGGDLTSRFPTIAAAVIILPVRSCIIDGELIAAGKHGEPNFLALLNGRRVSVCVYAIDLLVVAGRDLRDQPLEYRRALSFPDPVVLLAECIRLGLEGIVAQRKDAAYRSGARSGWIKVKTSEWSANQYRAKLFETR